MLSTQPKEREIVGDGVRHCVLLGFDGLRWPSQAQDSKVCCIMSDKSFCWLTARYISRPTIFQEQSD